MTSLATPEGTARYRDRFAERMDPGHFRKRRGLVWSSLGIGSYLGAADEAALADEVVQKHLEGREPKKVIVVPGRMVNLVG